MVILLSENPGPSPATEPKVAFHALYETYFGFVWRTLWRLGVWPGSVADAAQDVFIVVHRRLCDLRSGDVARSWLYGIVVRVARDYRRAQQRRAMSDQSPDGVADTSTAAADQRYERQQAVALLDQLLDQLDEQKREVLVLVELEQMSAPEIAKLLGVNPNTVYTRLRAARAEFERALARHRARARGDQP